MRATNEVVVGRTHAYAADLPLSVAAVGLRSSPTVHLPPRPPLDLRDPLPHGNWRSAPQIRWSSDGAAWLLQDLPLSVAVDVRSLPMLGGCY